MDDPQPDPDRPILSAAYRDLQGPGSASCPSAEALAALALGERPADRERLADHVVSCRRCSEDMQTLLRTHDEATAARRPSRAWPWLFAAAAAVLGIIAVGVPLIRRAPRAPASGEVERGAGGTDKRLIPAPGARLDRVPEEFAWPAQEGADAYRVRIFALSGALVWESETRAESRIAFPAAAASSLRKGETYFWTVEVVPSADHRRLGPFRFSVR